MTTFRFSLAVSLGLVVGGCSSDEAFKCAATTYDMREIGGPALNHENVTFVIRDGDTVQSFGEGSRSPPVKANVTATDISFDGKIVGIDTIIRIDRVKGTGFQRTIENGIPFMISLSDCKKSTSPKLDSKI